MPQPREPRLSLAEWLVLCLVSEEPAHGFAIAGLLAHDGSLGQIWHVPRQVVYRAARRLERLGLIMVSEKQPSRLGPDRAQLQATPAGRQAAGRWLREPTGHPRDIAPSCWSSWPCSTGRGLTPGTCCGLSATSSPRSLLRSRAIDTPLPAMTAF